MSDVFPEVAADLLLEAGSRSFGKEALDSLFTTMTERRVTHVVRITGSLYDGSNLFKERTS